MSRKRLVLQNIGVLIVGVTLVFVPVVLLYGNIALPIDALSDSKAESSSVQSLLQVPPEPGQHVLPLPEVAPAQY
jgi:hypothetical protein